MSIIKIQRKNIYGNNLIYPDNLAASIFTQLIGKKTLSESDLKLIEKLGFTIVEAVYITEILENPEDIDEDNFNMYNNY